MIDWDPNRARWEQIYDVLVEKIRSGELLPGDRLPGIHDLMRDYGVANSTAQKVLRGLRAAGYAYTTPGLGTFVSEPPGTQEGASPKRGPS